MCAARYDGRLTCDGGVLQNVNAPFEEASHEDAQDQPQEIVQLEADVEQQEHCQPTGHDITQQHTGAAVPRPAVSHVTHLQRPPLSLPRSRPHHRNFGHRSTW